MMDPKQRAVNVVDQMYEKDYFSQWLGIERLEDAPGRSILRLTIRKEMLNGHGTAHGGITYSMADSAFAFASNSHGRRSVSIETSISHMAPLYEGDIIIATATEEKVGHKIGFYQVRIAKTDGTLVALFKGTVFRTSEVFPE